MLKSLIRRGKFRRWLAVPAAGVLALTGVTLSSGSAHSDTPLLGQPTFVMHMVNGIQGAMAQSSAANGQAWRPMHSQDDAHFTLYNADGTTTQQTYSLQWDWAANGSTAFYGMEQASPATGPFAATAPTYNSDNTLKTRGSETWYIGESVPTGQVMAAAAQLQADGLTLIASENNGNVAFLQGVPGVQIEVMDQSMLPPSRVLPYTPQAPIDLTAPEHFALPTNGSASQSAVVNQLNPATLGATWHQGFFNTQFGNWFNSQGAEQPPNLEAPYFNNFGLINGFPTTDVYGVMQQFVNAKLGIDAYIPTDYAHAYQYGASPFTGFYGVVIATDDYGVVHCGLHVDSNQNPADDVPAPDQGSGPNLLPGSPPTGVQPTG